MTMAEDVKIIPPSDESEEDELSKSMPSTKLCGKFSMKDGSLSSRIPRFSRRASATTTGDCSDRSTPTTPSQLDVIYRNAGRKIKRHHSIYEGASSFQFRTGMISSPTLSESSSNNENVAPSPTLLMPQQKARALRRNKSFTSGDQLRQYQTTDMSKLQTYTQLPAASSSPTVTPRRATNLTRAKSFSSLKASAGILTGRPSVNTKAVKDPGRVQVFVRIRPPNESEDIGKHPIAVSIEDEESTQLKLFDGKNDRCYQFDGVLPECSDNKEVYKKAAEPLVYSALCGFNGILMCYGQTGTGKTYSLMSNDGMSVRIVCKCFKVINNDKKHRYTVTCSYLQIYQEKIFDLLNETRTIDLSLREHPKTGVYIENLTEYVVHSPKDVLNLLKVGKRRLVFAETRMNRASSRSHAICQLKILKERVSSTNSSPNEVVCSPSFSVRTPDMDDLDEYYEHDSLANSFDSSYQALEEDDDDDDGANQLSDLEDGVTSVRGKMYICDLAGSERIKKTQASGERLSEAQHINSSLLELGNVIQALAEGKRSHVPFRNSTLTRLLQEGLSGNCKTRLVVCVAPTVKDVHETKCSLNFGSRAMKVQVMAHVNYEVDYKRLAEALAAKLETLEEGWNIQKEDYEKVINQLKSGVDGKRLLSPVELKSAGNYTNTKHVQALLVVELMTLQLYYNFQKAAEESPTENTNDQDLVLQSMEGLLELLNDYLHERYHNTNKQYSNHSSNSSVITSPDYLESSASSHQDVPNTLEPISRFIEHARITCANAGNRKLESSAKTTRERFKRVMNSLVQTKQVVSQGAVKHLKETFKTIVKDEDFANSNKLDEVVSLLEKNKALVTGLENVEDIQILESSLYFLLLDKSLLSCLLLLKAQAADSGLDMMSGCLAPSGPVDADVRGVLEELRTERNTSGRLQEELYALREDKLASEEKLKDIELDLQTVRELKEGLETKLCAVEERNRTLEERINKVAVEKERLEKRVQDVEARRVQLESSLKTSENNNARKERLILDLKNEKVALDSLVQTLKEELTIMEKEKAEESDERRHIQEELEDVRDRNIILETEWSCCKEENGLLENELTALEEDKALLEEELSKYCEDVRMLEEAVSVLEAQSSDYKHDIVALKSKEERLLSSIRLEKDKFTKEMNSLRQEMSALRVERRRFQRDISVARADKSNTERAYTALKGQKESIQDDIQSYKQLEKRMQRELATLKTDRSKLEREVNGLKAENHKLKQELALADKMKSEIKLLQKNEEKIASMFNLEKDKIMEQLGSFKEKYERLESDFSKVYNDKERLIKQLKRFENNDRENTRRAQSLPTTSYPQSTTPDKIKSSLSVQGALVRRSVHSGEVSEIEGRVLDLQRRLAFFMAEKEDIQKELITSRERNTNLTSELKLLEEDTSKIQTLLSTLTDEKQSIESRLQASIKDKEVLEHERDELKTAVDEAKSATEKLQEELEVVSEKNRMLEVDQMTVRESVRILQNETVVLATENKHVKQEFEKVEGDLKHTRTVVTSLNQSLVDLKKKVEQARASEQTTKEKLMCSEVENASLTTQLEVCESEEEILVSQLVQLNKKFTDLEKRFDGKPETKSGDDSNLKEEVNQLKVKLSASLLDVETLKKQREEIHSLIGSDGTHELLVEDLTSLKEHLVEMSEEKSAMEKKLKSLQHLVTDANQERADHEKTYLKQNIDKLQQQIEELVRERMQLEAEVEYLKNQNNELRKEIAVILHENTKLENELEQLEDLYDKQETDLHSATEETKSLLRQLCATEAHNLDLSTQQCSHQDRLDGYRKVVQQLQAEKAKIDEEKKEVEERSKTLKERLLMAELEISQLRSDVTKTDNQNRLLVADLETADSERSVLKTELHELARAFSPLKREVTQAIQKREEQGSIDIEEELQHIKGELDMYNNEKVELQLEQDDLEQRINVLSKEREGLRGKLRKVVQDIDERTKDDLSEDTNAIEESIRLVGDLLSHKDELLHTKEILLEDLQDAAYTNKILSICVISSREDLKSVHEDLCLATVERLKMKDSQRQLCTNLADIKDNTNGLTPLQFEIKKLKLDIESFEKSQASLLDEIKSLNSQLDVAENNLINVDHFKKIIEANLLQYKERNVKLETHLRVIYDDLIDMESHMSDAAPSKSAKVLLETLDLHRHFQYLEDDLRSSQTECRNYKEDAADLLERCNSLQEEKQLSSVSSGFIEESLHGRHSHVNALQKERDSLLYEKTRLESKLEMHRGDKKRILEDYQRMSRSLSAYAKYNAQLEKKLQSMQVDLDEIDGKSELNYSNAFTPLKEHAVERSNSLLCNDCQTRLDRNFLGVSDNKQLLGNELFDCIQDNMGIQAAILSFMSEKQRLERELVVVEGETRDAEDTLHESQSRARPPSWLSEFSLNSDISSRSIP